MMPGLAKAVFFLAVVIAPGMAEGTKAKIVNIPSDGWVGTGTAVKIETVKDNEVQGGTAERVTICQNSHFMKASYFSASTTQPLKKGDVLLLAFWAKVIEPPGNSQTLPTIAGFERSQAPFRDFGYVTLNLESRWKMYYAQAVTDQDYKAKEIIVHLEFNVAKAVFDLGPVFIMNYGKDYDLNKLPRN